MPVRSHQGFTFSILTIAQLWPPASDHFVILFCAIQTIAFAILPCSVSFELENAPTFNFYIVV
jgi:hypothetical protein